MHWYKPASNLWLRCNLQSRVMSLVVLEVLLTGEIVSGRAHLICGGWILENHAIST